MNTNSTGLQKTFSNGYSSVLKQRVKDGNISNYFDDSFSFDDNDKNVFRLQGIMSQHAELDAEKDDFENAVAFFNAHKEITPFVASQESFWAYLTHVEYYEYVKNRWFKDEKPTASTIKRRFFYSGSSMDNALSRLWWSVYLTKDENLEDPYKYTKVILGKGNSDLLQNLSKSRLYRLKDAVHGILKFFSEYEVRTKFSAVNRFIVQYFNRYSGVKQLAYMNEDFFYETSNKALEFYKRKNKIQ